MPPPRRSALDARRVVAVAAGGLAAMARQAMGWLAPQSMAQAAVCSLGRRRERGRRRAESEGKVHAVEALAAAPHGF